MDKVLVKQAISPQYPIGAGAPIMVVGGGGNRGGGNRGRTLRQRAGGALGGLVGVAGALTGQHRSLGGLTQSMISGGAQGRQLGEALGRFASGRDSRARAKLRQSVADKYADAKASGEFDRYGVDAGRTAFTRFGQGRMSQNLYDLEQAKQAEKNAMAEARAKAMAEARAFGSERGEERRRMADDLENFVKVTGMDPARASEFMSQFGQRVSVMQEEQQTPPAPLQLGAPPIPPSDATLGATAELNHPISPDQVDGDTENEPSDNMTQTPQGDASALPQNQVKVMNNPQQIRAARQKVEDREEMME